MRVGRFSRRITSWFTAAFCSPAGDAGPIINEDTAISQNTAWACGTLIARSIAMLPARVMAPRGRDEGDGNEMLPNNPVGSLLHREPNSEMTAFKFREGALLSAIFKGSAYAEIERDQLDRPVALWPIHTDGVAVYRADSTGALEYEVDNGGGSRVTIASRDMFHLAAHRCAARSAFP